VIFHYGAKAENFCIILDGKVSVLTPNFDSPDKKLVEIAVLA
jgi:hypothetical protein